MKPEKLKKDVENKIKKAVKLYIHIHTFLSSSESSNNFKHYINKYQYFFWIFQFVKHIFVLKFKYVHFLTLKNLQYKYVYFLLKKE